MLTSSIRLLLVEDHDATREALALLLKKRGFAIRTAATVKEARLLLADFAFDLVLSDLGLPDASGLDLMYYLRTNHPGLQGIALTAYGTDNDFARSRAAGFSAHLVKPVSVSQLEPTIRALLAAV